MSFLILFCCFTSLFFFFILSSIIISQKIKKSVRFHSVPDPKTLHVKTVNYATMHATDYLEFVTDSGERMWLICPPEFYRKRNWEYEFNWEYSFKKDREPEGILTYENGKVIGLELNPDEYPDTLQAKAVSKVPLTGTDRSAVTFDDQNGTRITCVLTAAQSAAVPEGVTGVVTFSQRSFVRFDVSEQLRTRVRKKEVRRMATGTLKCVITFAAPDGSSIPLEVRPDQFAVVEEGDAALLTYCADHCCDIKKLFTLDLKKPETNPIPHRVC